MHSASTTILHLPQGATALTTLAGQMAAMLVVSLNRARAKIRMDLPDSRRYMFGGRRDTLVCATAHTRGVDRGRAIKSSESVR